MSAIGCLVSVLVPFCPTPLMALLPVSLSYFAIVAGSVNIYTIPLDIWGGEHAGTAIAALGFAYGLMQTAISPLIGFLVDHFGFAPVCWLVAAAAVCGLGAAAMTAPRDRYNTGTIAGKSSFQRLTAQSQSTHAPNVQETQYQSVAHGHRGFCPD